MSAALAVIAATVFVSFFLSFGSNRCCDFWLFFNFLASLTLFTLSCKNSFTMPHWLLTIESALMLTSRFMLSTRDERCYFVHLSFVCCVFFSFLACAFLLVFFFRLFPIYLLLGDCFVAFTYLRNALARSLIVPAWQNSMKIIDVI